VIVADLRKRNFRPFPKIKKAKSAGETEEVVEGEEEEEQGSNSDYDYLLGMPIWSLTTEKVEKLLKERDQKEIELTALLETTPHQLWDKDLDAFLAEHELFSELHEQSMQTGKVKKQAKLRTRKSIGGKGKKKKVDSDEEDDDFVPSKAGASKKADKPKAAPKPRATKAKVGELFAKNEDDDEKPPIATRKPASKPTSKKPKVESDIEMGTDEEDVKVPVAPARKAPVKKRPVIQSSEVDEDEDIKPVVSAAAKGKGKAKAVPEKRKAIRSEEDESEDDMHLKPAKKSKPSTAQATMKDFFDQLPNDDKGKASASPKAKAAPSKTKAAPTKAPAKKKAILSDLDDEGDSIMEDAPPPSKPAARAPRRAAAVTKKYVDVASSDGEAVGGGGDDDEHSVFEISD